MWEAGDLCSHPHATVLEQGLKLKPLPTQVNAHTRLLGYSYLLSGTFNIHLYTVERSQQWRLRGTLQDTSAVACSPANVDLASRACVCCSRSLFVSDWLDILLLLLHGSVTSILHALRKQRQCHHWFCLDVSFSSCCSVMQMSLCL